MMSAYAQATQNSINNTVNNKLKSFKRTAASTTSTKDKLCNEIKKLWQQLAKTKKPGEGTKTPPHTGPME